MITISTHDLVRRLQAVHGLSPSSKIDPDNALVRVEWTGTLLRISAYATNYGAVAVWQPHPGDDPGDDTPWEILLPNSKTKEIIDTFELKGEHAHRTPLDVEVNFDTLRIRRAGSADDGVPAKSYGYTSEIEHNPPKSHDVFADLGELLFGVPIGCDSPAMVGLAAAMKRTGQSVWWYPHEQGVRAEVGDLTVWWRHPIDPDVEQAAADEAAVVEESLASVGAP